MYDISIASLTPTVCSLFGIDVPSLVGEPALNEVLDYGNQTFGLASIERCLVFCPDALGNHVWSRCPVHTATISSIAPKQIGLRSVIPPKTPVCFASMFTGAQPEHHGIRRYERPVLTCDTLFDALIRTGKRVAIVAVCDSSVDLLFRDRAMTYYSEPCDQQVTDRALATINANTHDFVVVYQQEYDDLLHETEPFSDRCLQSVGNHVSSFVRLAQAARSAWSPYNHAVVFAPDHGAHTDPKTGKGDHGLDIPEDMSLSHCYGMVQAVKNSGPARQT